MALQRLLLHGQTCCRARPWLCPGSLRAVASSDSRSPSEASEPVVESSEPASNLRPRATSPARWLRRARTRANLALAEFRDLAAERQQSARARLRQRQQELKAFRDLPASEVFEGARVQFVEANRRFDDRFNAAWYRLVHRVTNLARDVQRNGPAELWQHSASRQQLLKLRRQLSLLRYQLHGRAPKAEEQETAQGSGANSASPASESKASYGPPLDTAAMALLGAGAGSTLQGYLGPGLFLSLWGLVRASRRFLVICIDTEDPNRLFRFAPESLRRRKGELFQQFHHELYAMRRIRSGDLSYTAKPGDKAWECGMDARYDHTPETLFDLSMTAIAAHPRVQEWVGETVRPRAEPDKVVFRIHEGIAEVFLGWDVQGELGSAEVQVKATGSIVDFIYIFPQGRDHYGLKPGGFVIRPNGDSWSQDTSELPKDLKQPFGKHNGRIIRNREGIFEYDYEVREFRHGYEGMNHPRAQAYRRRWGGGA